MRWGDEIGCVGGGRLKCVRREKKCVRREKSVLGERKSMLREKLRSA